MNTNLSNEDGLYRIKNWCISHVFSNPNEFKAGADRTSGRWMITLTDITPFAGSIGGGFIVGLTAGYAIKKVIKIAAVIAGLFIAALAYLEYQRIIDVNWVEIQAISENGLTWVENNYHSYIK